MEPDRFSLRDHAEAPPRDAAEPELYIRTSDEEVSLFDSRRIVEALIRETNLDSELAIRIGLEIREFVQNLILKLGTRTLNSSMIRGLVDTKLLELGLEEAHRSHTRLGVPVYDVDRIIHSSVRDTGSRPHGPEGSSLIMAEAIKREYAVSAVFTEAVANAHLAGDIHVHGLGAIDRPYSVICSVDHVKQFGLVLPEGFASSHPARHPEVLTTHMVKLSAALQGYLAGPVIWDAVNFAIAPLLRGCDDRAIKQLAQNLVFEFSATAVARGGHSMLVELHLDWDAPMYLKSQSAVGAGGERTGKSYDEYTIEAQRFLQSLIEVYLEGDAAGRPFLSPRLILHINPHFNSMPGYRSVLELISRLAVERGGVTIAFDRDDDGSYFRRYGVDEGASTAADSHGLRASQFQIVSLNLPRVGYLTDGSQVQVFEELSRLMDTAAQAHLEKRVFLEKLLALGERGPLSVLATRTGGGPFLRLNRAVHAISVVGLNELCRAAVQSDLHDSQESLSYALKVVTHLRREAERLSQKHNVRFLLSGQSTEVTSHRLARLDLRFFGKIAEAVVCGDVRSDSAYYTDGVRLPAASNVTVLDRLRTEGLFHDFGLFNATTEIWMGEPLPRPEELGRLISQAFYKSSSSGLVFCPEFTICVECKTSASGLHTRCPKCDSRRVDGLAYSGDRYGYTSSWNSSRLKELRDRRRVSGSEM
jgi:ribonucleoside-triphosphate reductase (formate)